MLTRPTPLSALTAWQADPVGLALTALLAGGYLLLARRVPGWSRWRTLAALAAAAGTLYLTCGFVGVYARVLLWSFTTQVVLLLVVVPLLLTFGRPLTLVRRALPGRPGQAVQRALRSRAGRVAASPATAPLVVPVVLALVFFTGLLGPLLTSAWAARAMVVVLLAVGTVIALPFGGDDEDATGLAIAAGIFLGFLELLLDAVPGIVVRLSTHPLALDAVTRRHAPWAPSPLHDQQYAGAVLWFLGETLDLPFLGLLVWRWVQADRAEAATVDAALDAAQAGRAPDAVAAGGTGELLRPWWETDPSVLGERRAEEIRRRSGGA